MLCSSEMAESKWYDQENKYRNFESHLAVGSSLFKELANITYQNQVQNIIEKRINKQLSFINSPSEQEEGMFIYWVIFKVDLRTSM